MTANSERNFPKDHEAIERAHRERVRAIHRQLQKSLSSKLPGVTVLGPNVETRLPLLSKVRSARERLLKSLRRS